MTLWLIKVLTTVSVLGSGGMLEGALANDSVTAKQLMLAETFWFSDGFANVWPYSLAS